MYFFGYGSLIVPDGINGRGMKYEYQSMDLCPSILLNHRRSLCALYNGCNFYGIVEDSESFLNGILFKIHSQYDYEALIEHEHATDIKDRTYIPTDVTEHMFPWDWDEQVMTLVCEEEKTGYPIPDYYTKFCYEAAESWGQNFLRDFLKDGGVKPL